MFVEAFSLYGDLNDGFLQNVYFVSNRSIFEIYRMTENNSVFKFLVNDGVGNYIVKEVPAKFQLNN